MTPRATPKPSLRLEWRRPSELKDNPSNWRRHPPAQTKAFKAAKDAVGWAGAALYNERTKRLIDGHMRKSLALKDEPIPVLVGSWTEAQERVILATLDPLAGLALRDDEMLKKLSAEITSDASPDVAALMASLNPKPPKALDVSSSLRYQVIVQCDGEAQQRDLLERFAGEGLECKALIS